MFWTRSPEGQPAKLDLVWNGNDHEIMRRRLLGWAVLACSLPLAGPIGAQTATEQLQLIQRTTLDPRQCYRVRDLFLAREDVKLYLTDGYLLFAKPFAERTFAAAFVPNSPLDQGEILVIPPTAQERQSLVRFISEPVLNLSFRSALMFFTDDTAEALRAALQESGAGRADAATGAKLASRWSVVMRNVLEGLSLRILFDHLSGRRGDEGFFAAAIGGGPKGRFDVIVDPRFQEQVVVGQATWRDGRFYHESWCSFVGRNFREGRRKVVEQKGRLENYRIESWLAEDLSMKVVAKVEFLSQGSLERAYAFELSEKLKLTKLLLDGQPAEFIEFGRPGENEVRKRGNQLIAVIFPESPRERHDLEFHYQGSVVSKAGDGVYYVGSRGSWYPRRDTRFTRFDLIFHHPEKLDLVATGDLAATSTAGGVRTSRFQNASPIRMAGFNLGRYKRESRQVGKYTVEVCANTNVETRLQPKLTAPMIWPSHQSGRSRRGALAPPASIIARPTGTPSPSPASRLKHVADDSAKAFAYFLELFGPPSTSKIVISPVPGDFGQGFPGLVYASTLSYLRPRDAPLKDMTPRRKLFYSELLRPHEIAHQWWGNVVSAESPPDEWLMEALATYSSLLLLEQRPSQSSLRGVLRDYQSQLLSRNDDGETIESAGPISMGDRLRSSRFPQAAEMIVYKKGAWVLHMLRGIMGNEAFFGFLRSLTEKYRFEALSARLFQQEAARFIPEDYPDAGLEAFFEHWVRGTGIPSVKASYEVARRAGRFHLSIRLQRKNIAESASVVIPLEVHTRTGGSIRKYVLTEGTVTELRLTMQERPSRLEVDPGGFTLLTK